MKSTMIPRTTFERWLGRWNTVENRRRAEAFRRHWDQWIHEPWIQYRLGKPLPPIMANESVGQYGERLAAVYLERKGYFILERSFRTQTGEIDLVAAWRKSMVVFVEVKTWQRHEYRLGGPSDRVDEAKQQKITNTALRYMKQHRLLGASGRADVIEVILEPAENPSRPSFRHFEYAFEGTGRFQMFS